MNYAAAGLIVTISLLMKSGIPEEWLRKAATSSVCKINIDSDSRLAMTAAIRKTFAEKPAEFPGKSALSDIAAVEQSHLILPPKTPTFHLSYHWQELPCEVTAWCLNKLNWFPSPKGCPIRCGRQWNHPFATDTLYYSKRTSRRMKSEKKFTLMLPEPCLPNSWKTWIPYNNYLPDVF